MADLTRRTALSSGAGMLALVATQLTPGPAEARTAHGRSALLREAELHRNQYLPHVGRVFHAEHDGQVHRVRLVSAEHHDVSKALRNVCFTLVFKPVGPGRLQDAIYVLRRPGVPARALLLTSLGTAGRLQAVINRAH